MTDQEFQLLEENWDSVVAKAIQGASRRVATIKQREEFFNQLKPCVAMVLMWFVTSSFVFCYQLARIKICEEVQLAQMSSQMDWDQISDQSSLEKFKM